MESMNRLVVGGYYVFLSEPRNLDTYAHGCVVCTYAIRNIATADTLSHTCLAASMYCKVAQYRILVDAF